MSERLVGTVSRGIRCPIIRQGDDLSKIVTTITDFMNRDNIE